MAILEDLKKKAEDITKTAVSKSKDLLDLSSLNNEISDQRDIIRKTYLIIGEQFYNENSSAVVSGYEDSFNIVNDANAKIDQLQEKIESIKGIITCRSCGNEMPKTSKFCLQCGNELIEPAKPDGKKKCLNCGSDVIESAVFCGECGNKF